MCKTLTSKDINDAVLKITENINAIINMNTSYKCSVVKIRNIASSLAGKTIQLISSHF